TRAAARRARDAGGRGAGRVGRLVPPAASAFRRRARDPPGGPAAIALVPVKRLRPTGIVLGLLCLMYLITYVDRVNLGTAAGEIRRELTLSNTQLGLVFSAFAFPYLFFQVLGGWIGDRFGPRVT